MMAKKIIQLIKQTLKKYSNKIKWVLILLLSISVLILLNSKKNIISSFEAYKKDGTYITQYQSQTINSLKKNNRELYNSIKDIKNVKQAAIIKYKYKYIGDTVKGSGKPSLPIVKDSTFTFNKNSDTLSYKIQINAPYINWYTLNLVLNDKLTIINRESQGTNEATVNTSTSGGSVTDAQIFNKKDNKNSFINRITFGPQIGVGVGSIYRTPDIYVGFGISYRLNKIQ